jgi:hypothetical protein
VMNKECVALSAPAAIIRKIAVPQSPVLRHIRGVTEACLICVDIKTMEEVACKTFLRLDKVVNKVCF